MSMMTDFYGDYGTAEAAALRKRRSSSIANQQAAFLGQQRGSRRIAEINRQWGEGFMPKMAEYGQRGLAGPNVKSGIQRRGLEQYAAGLQRDLGEETTAIQEELNRIAMEEAAQQADVDAYINELRLQKQRDIINSATALKQFASY